MARIRTIKPEFWSSPDVGDLTRDARLAFIGLWNEADDHGRLEVVPAALSGTIFPYDHDITVDVFCGLLNELGRQGLVTLYAKGRRAYLHITGWQDHQRVDRPSKTRCPEPEDCRQLDGVTPTISADLARSADDPSVPDILATPSRESNETVATPQRTERRNVGTSERRNVGPQTASTDVDTEVCEHDSRTRPDDPCDDCVSFHDEFWPTYPERRGKKVGKAEALVEWRKLTADEQQRALAGAKNLAAADHMPKDAHRFLRKSTAGAFPFDDWQEPAARGSPGVRDVSTFDGETREIF